MSKNSKKLGKACSECGIVIQTINDDLKKRISDKFLKLIESNSLAGYVPEFDLTQPLENQKLMPETYALIIMMLLNDLCDTEEEKREILKLLK